MNSVKTDPWILLLQKEKLEKLEHQWITFGGKLYICIKMKIIFLHPEKPCLDFSNFYRI